MEEVVVGGIVAPHHDVARRHQNAPRRIGATLWRLARKKSQGPVSILVRARNRDAGKDGIMRLLEMRAGDSPDLKRRQMPDHLDFNSLRLRGLLDLVLNLLKCLGLEFGAFAEQKNPPA